MNNPSLKPKYRYLRGRLLGGSIFPWYKVINTFFLLHFNALFFTKITKFKTNTTVSNQNKYGRQTGSCCLAIFWKWTWSTFVSSSTKSSHSSNWNPYFLTTTLAQKQNSEFATCYYRVFSYIIVKCGPFQDI